MNGGILKQDAHAESNIGSIAPSVIVVNLKGYPLPQNAFLPIVFLHCSPPLITPSLSWCPPLTRGL